MSGSRGGVPAFDVVIAGGGPGGCATALSLREHAPALSVLLVEGSSYEQARLGETLPPITTALLEHLGVRDAFRGQLHRRTCGTATAWGAPALADNDFVYGARGDGWHLDRAAFDAMLACEAATRGAAVLCRTRVARVARVAGAWDVTLSSQAVVRARFLVDATGPSAVVSRLMRAGATVTDRLTGFAAYYGGGGGGSGGGGSGGGGSGGGTGGTGGNGGTGGGNDTAGRTVVEAFSDGWWYTAALPGGMRVVACMTDADIGRRLRLASSEPWDAQLQRTQHVAESVRGLHRIGGGQRRRDARRVGDEGRQRQALAGVAGAQRAGYPPRAEAIVVRPARSRLSDPVAGDGWLAVGDAASSVDPLSSQGICRALRSGVFASYAIGDLIERGRPDALDRYRRFARSEFARYLEARAAYYALERRWPASEFWRRRQVAP